MSRVLTKAATLIAMAEAMAILSGAMLLWFYEAAPDPVTVMLMSTGFFAILAASFMADDIWQVEARLRKEVTNEGILHRISLLRADARWALVRIRERIRLSRSVRVLVSQKEGGNE